MSNISLLNFDSALTFGNSSDQYFNTYLMIQFKVLNIQKYSEAKQLDLLQTIIMWILIILSSIGILSVFIYSIKIIKRKHREKDNLNFFLNEIEGLTPHKRELVESYKNIENLKKASKEEIAHIVGKKLANKIHSSLVG